MSASTPSISNAMRRGTSRLQFGQVDVGRFRNDGVLGAADAVGIELRRRLLAPAAPAAALAAVWPFRGKRLAPRFHEVSRVRPMDRRGLTFRTLLHGRSIGRTRETSW